MGGIGKTVLATALVRDEEVRERFPDGVFWLSFGREAVVTLRQAELARLLGDSAASFESWQQGRSRLSELTADRAALVVLDDVWQAGHAEGFTRLGPGMGLVVTSRDRAVLEKAGVRAHRLDLLSKNAARVLLHESAGLAADGPPLADEIARECGFLPLAISVVGALIRTGRFDWNQALARLKAADIKRLRAKLPEYEAESVLAALQVSVEECGPMKVNRFSRWPTVLLPNSTSLWSTPSIGRSVGILPPTMLASVGMKSMIENMA